MVQKQFKPSSNLMNKEVNQKIKEPEKALFSGCALHF